MERCPHCRARLRSESLCPRCGADLGLVLALEKQARLLAQQSVGALRLGDHDAASRLAAEAARLHATPFHHALVGFVWNRKLSKRESW
ncbi:MAG: hypothetical protein HQL31_07040 [Planctomycetes bacterium]|nr:hypothetical protein [Planctomycetota bacterium]